MPVLYAFQLVFAWEGSRLVISKTYPLDLEKFVFGHQDEGKEIGVLSDNPSDTSKPLIRWLTPIERQTIHLIELPPKIPVDTNAPSA